VSNLAAIRDLVEADLMDSANAYWATGEIDAAIRRALYTYNRLAPRQTDAVIDTAADTREYSLAALTGIMQIVKIWHPWNPTDPAYPPETIDWGIIGSMGTVRLEGANAPAGDGTDKLRVFYHLGYTIEDLDSATATTLNSEGEWLIVLGATAYAAIQLAQSAIGTVNATNMAPTDYRKWADRKLTDFHMALHQLRRRSGLHQDARTTPAQDLLL